MSRTYGEADIARGVADARRALHIEAQAVREVGENVLPALPAALALLGGVRGRIVVSGLGKSGHIGAKIAATLASTGSPAFFVHTTEALHGDSGMFTADDAAVLISNSGETAEVCRLGAMLSEWGIAIVVMSADPNSTLAGLADVFLCVKVAQEADPLDLAPTASTAATLAVGDALAVGLMGMSGFTSTDFHARHPGGSLGRALSEDLGRTPNDDIGRTPSDDLEGAER